MDFSFVVGREGSAIGHETSPLCSLLCRVNSVKHCMKYMLAIASATLADASKKLMEAVQDSGKNVHHR